MRLYRELCDLEERGIDLIEILGQDRPLRSPDDLASILRGLPIAGDDLHAELLFFLTRRQFTPAQAKALWGAIARHRRRLAGRLGRAVRFRVAALDYLSSGSVRMRGVRLIAREEFEGILANVNLDELTGAFNRRYFNERLAMEVQRARRYGSLLSLLIIDLDNFKRVNDALGHVRGDALLRRLGRALQEKTRQTDAVCRYGGDEFAVILPETSNSEAYTLAERIREAATAAIAQELSGAAAEAPAADGTREAPRGPGAPREFPAGEPGREAARPGWGSLVGVSIGGATFPVDCDEAEDLVCLADRLCLEAKRSGKNAVRMSGERPGRAPEGART